MSWALARKTRAKVDSEIGEECRRVARWDFDRVDRVLDRREVFELEASASGKAPRLPLQGSRKSSATPAIASDASRWRRCGAQREANVFGGPVCESVATHAGRAMAAVERNRRVACRLRMTPCVAGPPSAGREPRGQVSNTSRHGRLFESCEELETQSSVRRWSPIAARQL